MTSFNFNTEIKFICDNCNVEKETDVCYNEIYWGRKCNKNICFDCCIFCDSCDEKNKEEICDFCVTICNRCKLNICAKCEYKYGRCEKCWYESPLCDFCENVEGNYKCEQCYKEVCYYHKKICYNCGTKCMDCHKNYDRSSCKDCKDDLSPEDVKESDELTDILDS